MGKSGYTSLSLDEKGMPNLEKIGIKSLARKKAKHLLCGLLTYLNNQYKEQV